MEQGKKDFKFIDGEPRVFEIFVKVYTYDIAGVSFEVVQSPVIPAEY